MLRHACLEASDQLRLCAPDVPSWSSHVTCTECPCGVLAGAAAQRAVCALPGRHDRQSGDAAGSLPPPPCAHSIYIPWCFCAVNPVFVGLKRRHCGHARVHHLHLQASAILCLYSCTALTRVFDTHLLVHDIIEHVTVMPCMIRFDTRCAQTSPPSLLPVCRRCARASRRSTAAAGRWQATPTPPATCTRIRACTRPTPCRRWSVRSTGCASRSCRLGRCPGMRL